MRCEAEDEIESMPRSPVVNNSDSVSMSLFHFVMLNRVTRLLYNLFNVRNDALNAVMSEKITDTQELIEEAENIKIGHKYLL